MSSASELGTISPHGCWKPSKKACLDVSDTRETFNLICAWHLRSSDEDLPSVDLFMLDVRRWGGPGHGRAYCTAEVLLLLLRCIPDGKVWCPAERLVLRRRSKRAAPSSCHYPSECKRQGWSNCASGKWRACETKSKQHGPCAWNGMCQRFKMR